MTELQLGCKGSVLMFSEDDTYCQRCPLKAECKVEVEQNQALIEQAVGRPVNPINRTAALNRKRRAMALAQSTQVPEPPKPPKVEAEPKRPVVVAPTNKITPCDAATLEGLQKKVREELARWVTKGIDPSVIESKQNPFEHRDGCKIADYIVRAILTLGLPTKKELKAEIVRLQAESSDKPWSDASLQSNINIVTGAFAACGYAVIKEHT